MSGKSAVERFEDWQQRMQGDPDNAGDLVLTEVEMDDLCAHIGAEHPLSAEEAEALELVVGVDTSSLEADSNA